MTGANPTLLADSTTEVIQHMNADHKEALVMLARTFAHIDSTDVTMTAVDRLGFHVRLKTAEGMRGARITFLREVSNQSETRKSLDGNGATGALAGHGPIAGTPDHRYSRLRCASDWQSFNPGVEFGGIAQSHKRKHTQGHRIQQENGNPVNLRLPKVSHRLRSQQRLSVGYWNCEV
jgi:Protein of unknown function (DUF2470)